MGYGRVQNKKGCGDGSRCHVEVSGRVGAKKWRVDMVRTRHIHEWNSQNIKMFFKNKMILGVRTKNSSHTKARGIIISDQEKIVNRLHIHQLKAFAALSGDSGSTISTNWVTHSQGISNSSARGFNTLFWLPRVLSLMCIMLPHHMRTWLKQ